MLFPVLFDLLQKPRRIKIANLGYWLHGKWLWDVFQSGMFPLQEVQMTIVVLLLNILEGISPTLGLPDRWVWWFDPNGLSVKSAYFKLFCNSFLEIFLNVVR